MDNYKPRQHIMIPSDGATKLAKKWFKKEIPGELLVRFNPREIVHAHTYGGLSKFFKGLTEGVLYGTKCWDCGGPEGNIWLPPRVHCPDCWRKMTWMTVDPANAKIYSHSTTNLPGAGFKGTVPCPLISLEIPKVRTRFMSYLSKFAEDEPYIGMPVKPVFRKKISTYTILDVSWVPID